MANNINVTEGSGKTVATEEIASTQYQLIKLIDSTAASTTPVGTSSNPLRVNPTGTTAQPVTDNGGSLTIDGTVALSGTSSMNIAQVGGATVNTGNGTASGSMRVTVASDNSTIPVSNSPTTSGGLSISRTISAASTNATSAKASAGQVYTIMAHNINASVRYLKLYNKASSPTVGTDTPVLTLPIPGNSAGAGFVLDTGGSGIAFSTGIAYAITTGVADSDTGAVSANEIVVNVLYK